MNGWLTTLGREGAALALLLLGHVLGDFVFQTDKLARNKHQFGPLLFHIGIVTLVHAVTFIPLLTCQTALIVAFIAVFHFLIDAVSARLRHNKPESVGLFLGDQIAHLVIIVIGWSLMDSSAWTVGPIVAAVGGVGQLPWSEMTAGAIYVSAFVFAHKGGNTIVRGVLPKTDLNPRGRI